MKKEEEDDDEKETAESKAWSRSMGSEASPSGSHLVTALSLPLTSHGILSSRA